MSGSFGEVAAQLCRFAAGTLGWRPDEFWAATPAELLGALPQAAPSDAPPTRAQIARMMEQERHG